MAKYFLGSVGTAEALRYNFNEKRYEVAFVSKTLTDSTLNISTTKDDIRGGTGAPIQFSFYHDPNVEITLTDIVFEDAYIEAQLGTKFDPKGEAYISEDYTAVNSEDGMKHKLNHEIADFGGLCGSTTKVAIWYSIDNSKWKMATTDNYTKVGNEITFIAPAEGHVCLRYYGKDDRAVIAEITSNIIPDELFLTITAPIYSGDACSASNGKKAGTITYEVPRFKLNGTQEFTMNMSQNQTMQLSGVALASESGCDITGSTLLRIIKVIDNYDPYSEAKAIFIDGDETEEDDIPLIKIVYKNGAVGIADNTKLTFTVGSGEAQAGTATKTWGDYIGGAPAGTYTITVGSPNNEKLTDSVQIEYSGGEGGDLTPFSTTTPYYISKVTVDPAGLTTAQMDAFLDACAAATEDTHITLVGKTDENNQIIYVDLGDMFEGQPALFIMAEDFDPEVQVVYSKDGLEQYGVPAGWAVTYDGQTFSSLEQKTDLTISSQGGLVDYITSTYSSLLETINGKVIGCTTKEEPVPPTPPFTPFDTNQNIIGIDFGNVVDGDTNGDLSDFVEYPASDPSEMQLVVSSDDLFIGRYYDANEKIGVLMVQKGEDTPVVLYASGTGTVQGFGPVTAGYNGLTDGKYTLDTTYEVTSFNTDVTGWNGILFGAVEAETPSLTAFAPNQEITGVDFGSVNTGDTNSTLNTVLAGLTYSGGDCSLVSDSNDDILYASELQTEQSETYYVLQVDGDIVYSTLADTDHDIPLGYQNLTDGTYSLSSTTEVNTITQEAGFATINGTVVGAILN